MTPNCNSAFRRPLEIRQVCLPLREDALRPGKLLTCFARCLVVFLPSGFRITEFLVQPSMSDSAGCRRRVLGCAAYRARLTV